MPMFAVKRLFQRHASPVLPVDCAPVPCDPVDRQFVCLLLEPAVRAEAVLAVAGSLPMVSVEDGGLPERLQAHCDRLLADKVARIHVTPYFPVALPRLLRLLRDPAVDAVAVAELVAMDTALTASVLRLANCPQLRCAEQDIDSLHGAAGLLGFEGLYALVTAAALEPAIMRQSRHFPKMAQRLWRHALCTAQLLQASGDTDAEGRGHAWLAGLLAGIGNSIVCHELQRHSPKLLGRMASEDEFTRAIERYSAAMTAAVADDWRLPSSLCGYFYSGSDAFEPAAATAAVARLERAARAVKAGMLVEHQRLPVSALERVCAGGPSGMSRRVLQLLSR